MPISQITANSIADGTITDAEIVAVANTKITGVLNTSQIANSAITADKIAPGAVVTFDSGTVMIFGQNTAPTGWTKDTTNFHNSSLRVVTGNIASGGTVDFTTAFASQTPTGNVSITAVSGSAGATTLTTPQIPSHAHNMFNQSNPNALGGTAASVYVFNTFTGTGDRISTNTPGPGPTNAGTDNTGGGGSHTHPFSFSSGSGSFSGNAINLAVKYVDVIRATKN